MARDDTVVITTERADGSTQIEFVLAQGVFVTQTLHSHVYDNGLVLVAEPMKSLESAAFTFLLPVGSAYDPSGRAGLANFTCEMVLRGCGSRDGQQFINDLDALGVEHAESVSDSHSSFGGATLAGKLDQVLGIYRDLLREPHLPEDKIEAARQVVLQELWAVEDEPSQKLMQELRRHHLPEPWGKPSHGDEASLMAITPADIKQCYQSFYRPNGMILGVAGNIDWPKLRDRVGELFNDWAPIPVADIPDGHARPQRTHLHHESQQTQIGVSYNSVPYRDPQYFEASASVGVLSSGMSARLFTEVREKRGLCYSVFASYMSTKDIGGVLCYAGTSADRAQETLDVTVGELLRLADGIDESELRRLKARVKSGLIMQQESSSARTNAIVRDWYHLGRVRTLDEVSAAINDLSRERINAYLRDNPPGNFRLVTLGPEPLEVPVGVS